MMSSSRDAAAAGTPSRPVRSSRQRVQSYTEYSSENPDTDEVVDQLTTTWPRSTRRSVNPDVAAADRPKRTTRTPRSYREPSSDEDLDRVISRYPEMVTTSNPPQSAASLPRRATRHQPKRSPGKRKKPTVASPRKRHRTELVVTTDAIPFSNGKVPAWDTLPYHILFNIFFHASHPLVDYRQGSHLPSVKWLLDVALLCHAFTEPSLSVLYHTPVLIPPLKAHKILQLLSEPLEGVSFNYASKVQELLVDVRLTLAYKAGPAYGYFDICKLLEKVPHIKTLRLYHRHDGFSPLMHADHAHRWTYPSSLFETLKDNNVRLHTFDWNARFMEPRMLIKTMLAHHLEAPFKSIRTLHLFQIPSDDIVLENESDIAEMGDKLIETGLGAALCQLPELRTVSFTDCMAVNELLFVAMPSTLESLTLDNCDEVATPSLTAFLKSHGANLRELVLKHNRHLNMSFTTTLRDSCPKLEKLSTDFIMHNWPPYFNGMPHFESLLKAGEIPTWPKTLQEIELLQLRQWDKPRAATFFSSLVDAAPELMNLRRIVISATIKMGWQDRASFRRQWIKKFEQTFLRQDSSPKPNALADSKPDHSVSGDSVRRHSHRESARLANQRLSGVDNDSDDSDRDFSAEEDVEAQENDVNVAHVQGLCDVVSLRIDNLRPADTQFNEGDFLNSEESGDEDWNGEDWEPGDDGHAW
ncbi:hypothetical protein BGW36DRAFT_375893 [Talaromyces proteolyticus]|uniref:Uncharacterized protein n=1 Tax=Talaromyces proteolyticus TaxID=1131652 RepID=A0AAD4KT49_9EURO|nr:uncharacterized protein BGW36DRAFT_375893 [Talaromyces proteolyticus]KAH8698335.1 hypothetical protein BGW36DRAFT_375893 [Talaromyces proteolyticus]